MTFFPKGSKTATATVCVESDDSFALKKLYNSALEFLDEYGSNAEHPRNRIHEEFFDGSDDGGEFDDSDLNRIVCECNGSKASKQLFLNEEDAISCVFGSCYINDEAHDGEKDVRGRAYKILRTFTVTIDYKNNKYANIQKLNILQTDPIEFSVGFRFIAEKNGGEPDVYHLLTQTLLFSYSKYYYEYEGMEILQTPSFGIVEGSGYNFAKAHLYTTVISEYYYNVYDDDINDTVRTLSYEYGVSAANLFLERNGGDFTFYVLINGELCKKISKTDEAVIFYKTRLSFWETESSEDIVFKNSNGVYTCDAPIRLSDNDSWTADGCAITLPPLPGNELTDKGCFFFYQNCVKALYEAVEGSEKLLAAVSQLSNSKDRKKEIINRLLGEKSAPIAIDRTNCREHEFYYKDVKVTADVFVRSPNMYFEEMNAIPFPELSVTGIVFEDCKWIELKPAKDELNIKITVENTGEIFKGKFELLKSDLSFNDAGIPQNLHFDPDWSNVTEQLDIYRRIKDSIAGFSIEKCKYLFDNDMDALRAEITEVLYGEDGMVPDENVINTAVRLVREYKRTGNIPNLAIVGQAGTGKTTLAKNLGKIFGKGVLALSPSDLRGAYLGHTKYTVVEALIEAAKNNQIFYVDEAYQLMDDKFGVEAVTVLLPLMTGDRTKVDAYRDKQNISIDFEAGKIENDGKTETFTPGIVPIWLSGYENEVRAMINLNQGLYRRLDKVVIKNPVTGDLLKQFDEALNKIVEGNIKDMTQRNAEKIKKYFDTNGYDPVKKFFGWGIQPQNSKFFASHAGVNKFLSNCLDSIDFQKDPGAQIEDIIISTKLDIKRQLATVKKGAKAVRSKSEGLSSLPDDLDGINVITDIDTRFSDLVGCKSQITYMQSIIEMLVSKGVYENYKMTVPKGALMEGLPGVGKTFIARAMAGELQERFEKEAADKRFGFIAVSGTELGNAPASYIASVFSAAEEYDACVLFIDEVDSIAKHRNYNKNYSNYLELIKNMDGIEGSSNVFILAATNAPENLDPAFVRSGRIDKRLTFTLPDKDSRKELVRRSIEKRIKTLVNFDPADKAADMDALTEETARRMIGFTAGDINNVINTAYITYHQFYSLKKDPENPINADFFDSYRFIDRDRREIKVKHNIGIKSKAFNELFMFIDEEIERINNGDPNYQLREEKFSLEKNGTCSSTAIHEVGHAVVRLMVYKDANPFDIITTLPRGDAAGYVSGGSGARLTTKADFENRIRSAMGGRIAEELFYGKDNVSFGAIGDMRSATYFARRMIEMYGFSDEFGFMALSEDVGKYIGGGIDYTCSEAYREKSDAAVNELLKKLYQETLWMLKGKKDIIEKLAREVFEKESMSGEEFKRSYETELKKQANK